MTGFEILHTVLDAALAGGVLFALHGRAGRRKRMVDARTRVAGEVNKQAAHVEIWKGEYCIGVRHEDHPDVQEALRTKGLFVRWPDGSIQEKP